MPEKVAATIREARQTKGFTQQELADLVGVARATVSEWERAASVPRLTNVARLSQVLGLDERLLMPFSDTSLHLLHMTQGPEVGQMADIDWENLRKIADGASIEDTASGWITVFDPEEVIEIVDFRLLIKDDSMAPVFRPGDRVRVRHGLEPYEGCQVIACSEHLGAYGGVMRNWVPRRGGAFDLVAENPNYPTASSTPENPIQIIGVLTRHLRVLAAPGDVFV